MQRDGDAPSQEGCSGSRGSTKHSDAAQDGRQAWGQLMPLQPVGDEQLSRSGSEEWELLPHHEPATPPAKEDGTAEGAAAAAEEQAEEEVQVCIFPEDDDEGSVKLRITPTASPLASPRRAESPPLGQADAPEQATGAENGSFEAASPGAASPLSGSAHSFEHLSAHFAAPASTCSNGEAASGYSDNEAIPSPPSLPDLEALPEAECDDGTASLNSHPSAGCAAACGSATPSVLEASFAEQLQLAASLGGRLPGSGSRASFVSSAIGSADSAAASPLGSSYSDLAASMAATGPAGGWEGNPALQQALAAIESEAGEQSADSANASEKAGNQDVEAPASMYDTLKAYLSSRMPSAAFTSLWETLQHWSQAAYMRMPALPPQLARPAALAGKHLRAVGWQRAALGASVASVAVLSFLLYSSHSTNRKLRAALGRKETDLLQLISRVVSLQRDMLRPRSVPIIRHTAAGACAWPAMDII